MGVNFEEKLGNQQYDDLWQEYCGFLNLDIGGYMQIQRRLMEEQIGLWSASALGKKLLDGERPRTIEEFRRAVPLTTFEDYADVLLQKRSEMLPAEPAVWIQTTWEGGKHPIKLAPYTRGMLDVFKRNMVAALMLATSKRPGQFSIAPRDRTLYGLAPLPYVTGLFPLMLDEELPLRFLPPVEEAVKMSFGERNKRGFALGLQSGLDLFFGLSSVISYITTSFTAGGGKSKKNLFQYSPAMVCRYLAASYRAKRDGRTVQPKDIFRLKALICAGTDTSYYKPSLEEAWGMRPMEIYAGTEPTLMATETWARNGLVFFPDNCFYEFIPEQEMYKNIDDRAYQPKTYLMDELAANQNYEVVITVLKGGAFVRYRVGDVFRCLSTGGEQEGTRLPRFAFVDRIPTVIDIGGFTRITEDTISDVVRLSGLGIHDWAARKEYSADNRPYLHLYLEIASGSLEVMAVSKQLLREHLSVYFKYFDNDYNDLKKMLGIEPLQITILRTGTFDAFRRATGQEVRRINESGFRISELLRFQERDYPLERGVVTP